MTLKPMVIDTVLRSAALAALFVLSGSVAAASHPVKARSSHAKATKKAPAKPVEVALPDASPEQVDAAGRVYYGIHDCEFKQTLDIERDAKHPAYVDVRSGKSIWTMKPVLSSTGAIRLEDVKGETLMVQISSKSMLLNVKTAHRVVDDCVGARQRELLAAAKVVNAAAEPPPLLNVDAAPAVVPVAGK